MTTKAEFQAKLQKKQQEHSTFLQNIFQKLNTTPQPQQQLPVLTSPEIEKKCYFHSQPLEAPPISSILQKANSISDKISDLKEGSFFITEHFQTLLLDMKNLKEYINQTINAKKGNFFNSRFTTILCEIISKEFASQFNFQHQRFKRKYVVWLSVQKKPSCYYHSNKDQKVDCKKKISMKLLSEFLPSFANEIGKGDCIGFIKHYLDQSKLGDAQLCLDNASKKKQAALKEKENLGGKENAEQVEQVKRQSQVSKKAMKVINQIKQQKKSSQFRVKNRNENQDNSGSFKARMRMLDNNGV